jgi:hypothetical protein
MKNFNQCIRIPGPCEQQTGLLTLLSMTPVEAAMLSVALAHTASSCEGQLPECRIKCHVQWTRGGHPVLEADGD